MGNHGGGAFSCRDSDRAGQPPVSWSAGVPAAAAPRPTCPGRSRPAACGHRPATPVVSAIAAAAIARQLMRIRVGAPGPRRSSVTLRCMNVRLGLSSDWVTTGTAERLTPRRFPGYRAQSRPARRAGDDDGWPLTGPGGSLWFVVDHGRRLAACGAGLDGSPGGGLGQCARPVPAVPA